MRQDDFRRIALGMKDAIEGAHMGHPDFRVGGRVFATIGYPGPEWATVMIDPDEQRFFTGAHPDAFVPVKGAWGRAGSTHVRLHAARVGPVRTALRAAWQHRAPIRPPRIRRTKKRAA